MKLEIMEKKCVNGIFKIPVIILLGMMFIPFAPSFSADSVIKKDKAGVVIGNNDFRYEIAGDGRNLHFTHKTTGADYLYSDSVAFCAYLMQVCILNSYHTQIASCTVSKEELLKEVTPIGKNPNLVNGQNEISFFVRWS